MDYEVYELTAKGKDMLKKVDKEFIKAWKEGHDIFEASEIALARVVQNEK